MSRRRGEECLVWPTETGNVLLAGKKGSLPAVQVPAVIELSPPTQLTSLPFRPRPEPRSLPSSLPGCCTVVLCLVFFAP